MLPIHLTAPGDLDPDAVPSILAPDLASESESQRRTRSRWFDTFDWRLHRAGLVLVREEGSWELTDLWTGGVVAGCPAWAGPWPRFADAFPPGGALRQSLQKLLGPRALVQIICVVTDVRAWRFLNEDGKVVLRAAVSDVRAEKPTSATVVRVVSLQPLRGYEEHAAAGAAAADARGFARLAVPPLDVVLAAAAIEPESYSSKFRVELAPEMTAREAAVRIGRALLRAIRANEAGVRADVDPEFLHDLRVAVRRLRSALGQIPAVFGAEETARFRREFAALGQLTGPLRDLDVYLAGEATYRAFLPPSLRPGLDGLFARLRAQRAQEMQQLRRVLASAPYRRLCADWRGFLAAPTAGPAADEPVLDLAHRRLALRYRRVIRRGLAIDAAASDRALHRLRIECKKLRYLLEFFASLFPEDAVAHLVGHLKGLQDNLGEFNDLSVQQRRLQEALSALPARRRTALPEAAALGGLVAALAARQREVRGEFAAAFAEFAAPDVGQHFAALCGDHLAAAEGDA